VTAFYIVEGKAHVFLSTDGPRKTGGGARASQEAGQALWDGLPTPAKKNRAVR